jgi:hypothetical protein
VVVPSQAQWFSTSSFVLKLEKLNGPVWETGLSDLATAVSWPRLLTSGLVLLFYSPPLDLPLSLALLCCWLKFRSSALSDPGCPLIHLQKIRPWTSTACTANKELW